MQKLNKIIIYGNGAMAKVLYSYARSCMDIFGFTVDDCCINNDEKTFCNLPLVPFSKIQDLYSPKEYKMISAVGFIDMNELREQKYNEAREKGYSFTSFVHNSVYIHDEVVIGDNCIILDYVSIHPGCNIGSGTFISSNVNIGHDCKIEPFNWINSGVSMAGECKIDKGCFFGVNSSLANGIKIGKRNFIAANTLINKNTNDNEVYISGAGELFKLTSKNFLKFGRMLN